jgi:hypothetical protein
MTSYSGPGSSGNSTQPRDTSVRSMDTGLGWQDCHRVREKSLLELGVESGTVSRLGTDN